MVLEVFFSISFKNTMTLNKYFIIVFFTIQPHQYNNYEVMIGFQDHLTPNGINENLKSQMIFHFFIKYLIYKKRGENYFPLTKRRKTMNYYILVHFFFKIFKFAIPFF